MARERRRKRLPSNGKASSIRPGKLPPFSVGNWVTPSDTSHSMHGKYGMVDGCEYIGCGLTELHTVTVRFEHVPPGLNKLWQFRHDELHLVPPAEVAGPYRKDLDL